MIKTLTNQIIITAWLGAFFFPVWVYGQEYLDTDGRYLKISAVSTDKTYGYDARNPIGIGPGDKLIGPYLNSLKTINKDILHIGDLIMNYHENKDIIAIVLTYEGKAETTTLFFSTAAFDNPQAPTGFLYKTADDIPKVVEFLADSIKKVTPCQSSFFAPANALLHEKHGEKYPEPSQNATYKGGIDELKKYFADNPLTDENAIQAVFRVHIALVVTCDGKAGNYEIISKGSGDLKTYANQVLAIVNEMPQNWKPAKNGDKAVDSYQVLSFTIAQGQINVSYR